MENFTKLAIQDRFMKLLSVMPIDKITVVKVVEACEMNRNTFYYHFKDINDLLDTALHDLCASSLDKAEKSPAQPCALAAAMGTLAASGPALRNLYKSEKSSVLLGHLEKMVRTAVEHALEAREKGRSKTPEGMECIDFCKVMFSGLVLDWLFNDMSYDLAEFVTRAWNQFGPDAMRASR